MKIGTTFTRLDLSTESICIRLRLERVFFWAIQSHNNYFENLPIVSRFFSFSILCFINFLYSFIVLNKRTLKQRSSLLLQLFHFETHSKTDNELFSLQNAIDGAYIPRWRFPPFLSMDEDPRVVGAWFATEILFSIPRHHDFAAILFRNKL